MLSSRGALWIVLALGALLFLPGVLSPFFLDDYLHASMVDGTFPVPRSPFDLYAFVDDGDRAALLARGLLPWWTHPGLTIRFFRPLSSALLYLDHTTFGRAALPMHLHSLAWWALAVVSARALFSRVLPARGRAVTLATAIFALAPCHAVPIAWLANREALVSLAFGALALSTYARFRDGGRARDAVASALLFAFALLGGGEYALAFGGYVLAIEIVRRGDSSRRRAAGLTLFAAPVAGYLAVRAALQYGSFGSGYYADPLRAPATFAAKAPWRVFALASDAWLSFDASTIGATWARALVALAVIAAGLLLARPVREAIARLDERAAVGARWMLLGSLLSFAPMLAVVPSPRLLGVSMLGVSLVVALVLDRAWFGGERRQTHGRAELVAVALGFAHLVHGPGTSLTTCLEHRRRAADFAAGARELDRSLPPGEPRVGVVRGLGTTFFTAFTLPRLPARWCVLADAGHVLVRRVGPRSIELTAAADAGLMPIHEAGLFRGDGAPLRVGQVVVVPGLRATILAVDEAGPRRVRFDLDFDPNTVTWASEELDGWKTLTLPDVGFGVPLDP